ncbi:hypothetical protein RUA4292_00604 [Ruegeria atlantica]|uniref:Uncharacterized protein n=2 Tax=Ruegeria atlantica TaxID=81569 RepID=A0A0P1EAM6_9RHOB|nr:DUF3578 domain-containing protein [Ruegeria atlantica]CUH46438.1 hypothetical protein RUA4292_00604 [Ruegeria atlantica]
MWKDLKKICELQPNYSSKNTPRMQLRGEVLRGPVKDAIEDLETVLAPKLGRFGGSFHVDASDGVGRKTELPWVRFCSSEMSPRPTEGFYCVIHFSTDGSAVHVTLSCGSSRFKGGEFVILPDREIDAQTSWARAIVANEFGSLEPFVDDAEFGATRPLPKAFQRAVAISKRVAYEDLEVTDFPDLFASAAERLKAIYDAQSTGRDLAPADMDEADLEKAISPMKIGGRRQGYGLPAAARKAVELRAMDVARIDLEGRGFEVIDRSANHSYDFEAKRHGLVMKVEVKGTTSDRADAILMTRNEVELHRTEKGTTSLMIVSGIRLDRVGGEYSASGGTLEALDSWDVDEWMLEATAFRVSRKLD